MRKLEFAFVGALALVVACEDDAASPSDAARPDAGGDVPVTETAAEVATETATEAATEAPPAVDVMTVEAGMPGAASAMMSFFITSETVTTPNLGGLAMADAKCQRLGVAAGVNKTWKAYLSTSTENARTRIGAGPWHNFKGELIAMDLEQLHEENGKKNNLSQATGLTDKGFIVSGRTTRIEGQSNEHDILTGSTMAGMVSGSDHCDNWTSTTGMKQVGHADRMGVQSDPVVAASWNSAHATTCANTSQGGGAGRFYCFASN